MNRRYRHSQCAGWIFLAIGLTLSPPLAAARSPIATAPTIRNLATGTSEDAGFVVLTFDVHGDLAKPTFDVRASVQHMSLAGNVQDKKLLRVPVRSAIGEDQHFALEIGPLEAGRTLQLMLRIADSRRTGPWSRAISARVPGTLMYPQRKNTVTVNKPMKLTTRDTRYVLTKDITCKGTAFTIAAPDVTLDLNGHCVRYGTSGSKGACGVFSEYLYDPGSSVVCNGTLEQAGKGRECPAVQFRGGHHIRLSALTINVSGPDTSGIVIYEEPKGDVRVDHCRIACRTKTVTDRSYPGVAAIWMEGIVGACEVDQNLVTASPQWGIKVQGKTTNGAFLIHHNRVLGTVSRVANAYMIGIHKPHADVYENELRGESRGIHIDGEDNFGHYAHVHHNRVHASDRPNPEYPDLHWTHGIKIERGSHAHIHHNTVDALGDADHGGAYALDIALGPARHTRVHHNVFRARSTHDPFPARALSWTEGPDAAPPRDASVIDLRHNVFLATDEYIHRAWGAGRGARIQDNVWRRDAGKGKRHRPEFERWDNSGDQPSRGHIIRDADTDVSITSGSQWASPGPFHSAREATITVRVMSKSGTPVQGARIRVRSASGKQVVDATANHQGTAQLVVRFADIGKGPSVTHEPPFQLAVSHGTHSYKGKHRIRGTTALYVTLDESSGATSDTKPPAAPTRVRAVPLSASVATVSLDGARDNVGVRAYRVWLDGRLVGTSSESVIELGGLEPGRTYRVTAGTVDHSLNASAVSAAVPLSMPEEDRGR